MKRTLNLLVLTIALGLLAAPAFAADNGFYLGASAGQAAINTGDLGDVTVDENSNGYKVFAGYRMLTFVAVEAAYVDLGSAKADAAAVDTRYEAKVKGADIQAVGFLPLGIADIFVKAGMISWDAKLNSITSGNSSELVSKSGTDPVYGAGVQFRIQSFAIRAEVEYFDVQSTDSLYMYSIGGSYTF